MDIEILINELIATTRGIIEDKYRDWGYHNLEHFEETIRTVYKLRGKIKERDWLLLMIATAFHDVVQDCGLGENERLSAEKATKWMQGKRIFGDKDMRLVEKIIMGTVPTFDGKGGMKQAAADSDNILVKLMADVDLINTGAEWDKFKSRVEGLWRERNMKGEKEMWLDEQKFLQERHFFTKYAEIISPHLLENKQKINDLLAKMTKGTRMG